MINQITPIDGKGHLQTVEQHVNPRYWALINAFKQETGVPVVLNTSFNENEPIVCNPDEAGRCLLRTKMAALAHSAIGNFSDSTDLILCAVYHLCSVPSIVNGLYYPYG